MRPSFIKLLSILGIYSRLELCFYLERRPGYFITALFFPATGIVAISWISLALGKDSTVSDMIQVILAVIFLNFTQNTVMPKVSYVKAIDVYMGACLFFVFLSLIKLSVYKYISQTVELCNACEPLKANSVPASPTEGQKSDGPATVEPLLPTSKLEKNEKNVKFYIYIQQTILKISAYLLPILFTSFCLFYFFGYFYLSKKSTGNQCNFDEN